jgi:serine/threonine protein kinase
VMTVIGEGAYGVVVRAVHRASGREVAIKKVSASCCSHVAE